MNPVPFLWLAAVVGFLLLEASTFSMTSVWFAVGAAAALLTCLFTDSFRAQALVFIVVSILCLLAFRPLAAKLRQKITPTNGDRNLGREATVLTTVTAVQTVPEREEGRRPSLVMRRLAADETLWDAAKQYRTDEELIRAVNQLTEGEVPDKMLLIPRMRP